MMEAEVWSDIIGYEDLYQVSSHGRVKRKDGVIIDNLGHKKPIRGKILRQIVNSGYH